MDDNHDLKRLRNKSHDLSFHSFGTSYIFRQRATYYNRLLRIITVLGILAPLLIGATVLGYGEYKFLNFALKIAIAISVFQVALSAISLVYNWNDELSYAFESAQSHDSLYDQFKNLGEFPPGDFKEAYCQFELINTLLRARNEQDTRRQIKDWESRMGMRYALREYQKECVECKKVPMSMKATDCPVCGNFKTPLINRL